MLTANEGKAKEDFLRLQKTTIIWTLRRDGMRHWCDRSRYPMIFNLLMLQYFVHFVK